MIQKCSNLVYGMNNDQYGLGLKSLKIKVTVNNNMTRVQTLSAFYFWNSL